MASPAATTPRWQTKLFASYSKVQDARSLASVIGADELSEVDRRYLEFGRLFEGLFVRQDMQESRTIDQTLDLGWKLLTLLPKGELDRVGSETIAAHYLEDAWKTLTDHPEHPLRGEKGGH